MPVWQQCRHVSKTEHGLAKISAESPKSSKKTLRPNKQTTRLDNNPRPPISPAVHAICARLTVSIFMQVRKHSSVNVKFLAMRCCIPSDLPMEQHVFMHLN